ncbi:MAG: helicase-related protein [Candidatus Cloacimonetes bacterium]|nr:helicase-related protein [Candidatus Cloacimonadota bacterium]
MQKIITNKQGELLGDLLKASINEDSKIHIVTDYFTIYSLTYLFEQFSQALTVRIMLTSNPLNPAVPPNRFHQNDISNPKFLGDSSEIGNSNSLMIRASSRICNDLLKSKIAAKSSREKGTIGVKFILIESPTKSMVITTPTSNFSLAGLGYTPSAAFTMNQLSTEPLIIEQYREYFEQFWNDADYTTDIKSELMKHIEMGYRDYSPQRLYFFTLFNIFSNNLDDLGEEKIIKTRTGFKDSVIWNKLYNFQKDRVLGAIDKIEKYNGCIIADSVGLGKTFEALAIIKYYELRNDRVLILCPKKLRENWTIYTMNDTRNSLLKDRFNFDVLNHTDLTRDKGFSGEINLENLNWSNYDLVVIDESHNFRNGYSNSSETNETRYSRLMNDIIKSGVRTKILMLSATPVNNRMNDLKNQVAFITEGNDTAFSEQGIDNISSVMRQAQAQFSRWLKDRRYQKDVKSLLETLDARYFRLLDLLTIARSKKHIQKYYDITKIGKFPERLKPINVKSQIDLTDSFSELKVINREIRRLNLSAYSPIKYVRIDKQAEYRDKYDLKLKKGSVFTQLDREQSLIHLMRVNMFKRMESSINSFAITLRKLLRQVDFLLEKLEKHSELNENDFSISEVDLDDPQIEDYLIGKKVKVLIDDMDTIKWKQDLLEDKLKLESLYLESSQVTPQRDAKLKDLKGIIKSKIERPINQNNKKVIVFTAFADTAFYLYENLERWALNELGIYSAVVTGSKELQTNLKGVRSDYNDILTNFSPIAKERVLKNNYHEQEIDLLIATDCISEGQNLQDCDFLVNYDIHWNPVRIIQRFGRIDRIGSRNNQIQLVNFWANMELDEYINLEARVSGRMVLLDISATGEENVIESKLEMNDLEYRRKQLEQLQHSVIDLEDIQGGISITDLTYNDFKIELMNYLKEHRKELERIPASIHAITKLSDDDVPEGVIFCLKQRKPSTGKNLNYNALEPYYLVYIDYNGDVVFSLSQNKQILDYYQKLCSGNSEVYSELVDAFKKETKNESDMSTYVEMLEYAVENILGIKQERGTASLFSSGGTSLVNRAINSLNDFEVISFLVVKK